MGIPRCVWKKMNHLNAQERTFFLKHICNDYWSIELINFPVHILLKLFIQENIDIYIINFYQLATWWMGASVYGARPPINVALSNR